MDDTTQAAAPLTEPLPTQPHNCTAVIEDLVALTPDDEWDAPDR